MVIPVPYRVYFGFGLLFLMSATIGINTYVNISKHEKISQKLSHIYQVTNLTGSIQNQVTDMVSFRRGYRSTHQSLFLSQYYNTHDQIISSITQINQLIISDPDAASRVGLISKQINDLLFFWSKIRLDESKYDGETMTSITFDEEKQVVALRSAVNGLMDHQNALLKQCESDNLSVLNYLSWSSPIWSITVQLFILTLIFLVIKELQKRKVAEAVLQDTIIKEKQINEMKSRFVSMASHEFRTPLAAIQASTYLAAKYKTGEDQEKREKHYERITSAVHNLTEILEDLLSVDKLEVGKIEIHAKEFDLPELINTTISDILPVLKHGQNIYYEHNGIAIATLDPSLIKHIITNLLSNSIKFSEANKEITLKSYHNNGMVMILVKDSGIGIPKNDQENLFDRFHRGANASNIEGTGLGLHIVAKYTKLMNGTVTCLSEEGKGTEFKLKFPQNVALSGVPDKPGSKEAA